MMHLMTVHGTAVGDDVVRDRPRARSSAAARSVADPAAMHRDALTDSEGSVLDPIVAIRNTRRASSPTRRRASTSSPASPRRARRRSALVEKYHDRHLADRVFELAWTHSQVVLRQLDATEADTQLYERLASNILYANPRCARRRA